MFTGQRVLVLGGSGFIGKYIVRLLKDEGADVTAPTHDEWNLEESYIPAHIQLLKPDYCVNLAGINGSAAFNRDLPADIFLRNSLINLHFYQYCSLHTKCKKAISIISSCVYPEEHCTFDMPEYMALQGKPNINAAGQAYAKRNSIVCAKLFHYQYGSPFITVCPPTVYGPGDSLDLQKSKVVGALLKKVADAKDCHEPHIEVWGNPHTQREFIYAEDLARFLLACLCTYSDSSEPINIPGQEMTIGALLDIIKYVVGWEGKTKWTCPDLAGQHRKLLNSSKFNKLFNYPRQTPIREGIRLTYEAM